MLNCIIELISVVDDRFDDSYGFKLIAVIISYDLFKTMLRLQGLETFDCKENNRHSNCRVDIFDFNNNWMI